MIGGECSHNELACVKQSYCEWPWSYTADEINYEVNSKDGTKQPFIHSGCDGLANSYYICYKTQLLSCLAALGKNPRWNFLDLDRDADQRQNRMVLASETCNLRICCQLLVLSSEFVEVLCLAVIKIPFKHSCIRIVIRITTKIYHWSHIPPNQKNSSKFRLQHNFLS